MSLTSQTTLRVVLYEGAGAQPLDDADRFAALTTLLERGFSVTRTLAGGRVAPQKRGPLLVVGKFSEGRAPAAEGFSADMPVHFRDISSWDSARLAECAEAMRAETGAAKHGDWKPWFPVI